MKRLLLIPAVAFTWKACAADAWFSWQKADGEASGFVTNLAHWTKNPATSTSAGDYLQFALADEDYTVSIPANETWSTPLRPFLVGHFGFVLTVDGTDAVWLQPDAATAYNKSRLQFRLSDPAVTNNDIIRMEGASADAFGGFRMTNPLLTVGTDEGSAFLVNLTRGTYDFLSPNGSSRTTTVYFPGVQGTGCAGATFRIGGSAGFSAYNVRYGKNGGFRRVVIDGPQASATLTAGVAFDATQDEVIGRSVLAVTNGATLSVCGTVASNASHPFDFLVNSQGTLVIPESKTLQIGSDAATASGDYAFLADRATVEGGDGTTLTTFGRADIESSTVSVATLRPSGNQLTLLSCSTACDMLDVKNDATVVVDGGMLTIGETFRLNYSGSGATLVLTNGGKVVYSKTSGAISLAPSATASCSLLVRGGSFAPADGLGYLSIGSSGGTGVVTVELSSGEIALGHRAVYVGKPSAGKDAVFLVSGGSYGGSSILMASSANDAAHESLFHQTGGTVVLTPYATGHLDGGYHGVAQFAGRSRLKLEGGTFTAPLFEGGVQAAAQGGAGYAAFEADGGTVKPTAAPSADGFIRGFDEAVLGESGLTIDADYDVTIPQAFANKPGADGRLILSGPATKTLTAASSSVSKIIACGGRIVLADGSGYQSELEVLDDAEIAFAGTSASSISGVKFGTADSAGVLKASPGVVPDVGGEVDIVNLKLALDDGFEQDVPTAILSAASFTEGSVQALSDVTVCSGLPDGTAVDLTIADEANGKSSLLMTLRAARTRTIDVMTGVSNVTEAIDYPVGDALQANVSAGAALNLSGPVGRGSLVKTGLGTLTLSNPDNVFVGGIVSESGLLAVSSVAALKGKGAGSLTVKGGTLKLSDEESPTVLPCNLEIDADVETDAVVVRTESDIVLEKAADLVKSGLFVKTGPGKLTIDTEENPLALSKAANLATGKYPTTDALVGIDANGTATGTTLVGFNILEGETELCDSSDSASFSFAKGIAIGLPFVGGTTDPGLTIHDTKVDFSGGFLLLGSALTAGNTFADEPFFSASNATLVANTVALAYDATRTTMCPKFSLNASDLTLSFLLRANFAAATGVRTAFEVVNGSTLTTPRFAAPRPVDLVCDASTVDLKQIYFRRASYDDGTGNTYADSYANMRFLNGSVFRTQDIHPSPSCTTPTTFEFDNAEWAPKQGVTADYTFTFDNPTHLKIVAKAGGLVLAPTDGRTWSFVQPVTGADGRIVKQGAGTVAFTGDGSYAFGGTSEVEAGVLKVAAAAEALPLKAHVCADATLDLNGDTHTGALVSGAGNICNGTLVSPTVAVSLTDAGIPAETPVLDFDGGLTVTGKLTFDLGCTSEHPFDPGEGKVVLAHYTGTPPTGLKCKLVGTGRTDKVGVFEFADGEVRVGLGPHPGLLLLFK